MAQPRHMATMLAPAALIVAATLVGRAFTMLEPGLHDAQLFRMIGSAWLDGWIPYRDLWDNKPPGIYALAAIIALTRLPFNAVVAVMEGGAVLLTAGLVFALLRELKCDRVIAMVGAVLAGVALNLDALNEGGFTTELFVAPCAAASMLLFLRARHTGLNMLVLAGLCAGMAMMFKQTGAAVLFAQLTFVLGTISSRRRHSARTGSDVADARARYTRGSTILALLIGAALPWLAGLLYFAAHHAADDFIRATFAFNLTNLASVQPAFIDSVNRFARALLPIASLALAAAALALSAWSDTRRDPTERGNNGPEWAVLILLWAGVETAGVMTGGRYYGHYLLALVPPLALAAALAIARLSAEARSRRVVLTAIVMLPLLTLLAADAARLVTLTGTQRTRNYALAPATTIRAARTANDSTLFTWDYLPAVYVATGLRPPVRFSYVPFHGHAGTRARIADSVLATLRRQPIAFLVDAGGQRPLPGRDSLRFHDYSAIVRQHYRLIFTDPEYGIRVFQRIQPDSARR